MSDNFCVGGRPRPNLPNLSMDFVILNLIQIKGAIVYRTSAFRRVLSDPKLHSCAALAITERQRRAESGRKTFPCLPPFEETSVAGKCCSELKTSCKK